MSTNRRYEKLKSKYRYLSQSYAELWERIRILRKLICYAKKWNQWKDFWDNSQWKRSWNKLLNRKQNEEKVSEYIDTEEIEKYERLLDDYCTSYAAIFNGSPNKLWNETSSAERTEIYQILKKTQDLDNELFRKFVRQYRLRTLIFRTFSCIGVILLTVAIVFGYFIYQTETKIQLIAQNIPGCSASESISVFTKINQLQSDLNALSQIPYLLPNHQQRIQALRGELTTMTEQKRQAQFLRVTQSIGDTPRYVTDLDK